MSMSVYLSACTHPNFTEFYVHGAYCHRLVLLWQRNNMSCTSGFVYKVVFSIMGPVTVLRPSSSVAGYLQRDSGYIMSYTNPIRQWTPRLDIRASVAGTLIDCMS